MAHAAGHPRTILLTSPCCVCCCLGPNRSRPPVLSSLPTPLLLSPSRASLAPRMAHCCCHSSRSRAHTRARSCVQRLTAPRTAPASTRLAAPQLRGRVTRGQLAFCIQLNTYLAFACTAGSDLDPQPDTSSIATASPSRSRSSSNPIMRGALALRLICAAAALLAAHQPAAAAGEPKPEFVFSNALLDKAASSPLSTVVLPESTPGGRAGARVVPVGGCLAVAPKTPLQSGATAGPSKARPPLRACGQEGTAERRCPTARSRLDGGAGLCRILRSRTVASTPTHNTRTRTPTHTHTHTHTSMPIRNCPPFCSRRRLAAFTTSLLLL